MATNSNKDKPSSKKITPQKAEAEKKTSTKTKKQLEDDDDDFKMFYQKITK